MKEKYLIFNEENKILVFYHKTSTDFNILFIPSTLFDKHKSSHDIEVLDILNKNSNDLVYLFDLEDKEKIYQHQNNKLIVKYKIKNKKYFGLYHEFTDEEIYKITKRCHDEEIEPYFLRLDDIIKLIDVKHKKIRIDDDLKEPVKILSKKLEYQEY